MRALGTWIVCACFLYAAQGLAKVEATIGPIPLNQNGNIAISLPVMNESEILISRDQYLISYNKLRREPNWVAWRLEAKDIGSVKRRDAFSKDPDLESYLASSGDGSTPVDPSEYSGSCFDRGHQIPSKDRTDNTHDNAATFLTSNIIPQTPYLNRVIWEHFEEYTRDLVQNQNKKVYVIAGPVFDEDFGEIGPHQDIAVPSKGFKIVIVLHADQTPQDVNADTKVIAVLMPNIEEDGSKPIGMSRCSSVNPGHGNQNDWKQYQTTVQAIEEASGIQFPSLDGK